MPYVETDMSKCESGKGKNFFDALPKVCVPKGVGENSRGRRAKIMCIDGVWFDFNYDPPKVWVDNDTTI